MRKKPRRVRGPQVTNQVKSIFRGGIPQGDFRWACTSRKILCAERVRFRAFLRENARVGAKSLLSKKATPFFDKLLLPQDPGLQGAAVGVVHPQARRHVDLRRRRPDIRHRRLDAAAAAGAEGPDGFPGQVIGIQEGVDDPGRGAPPDGKLKCSPSSPALENTGLNGLHKCVFCSF